MKTTAKQVGKLLIEVGQHPGTRPWGAYPHLTGELWRAVVTTPRGRCYYCDWSGDRPSEEKVLQAWRDDRKAFQPDPTGGACI